MLSNIPRPGASELSSGQIWSHQDAQTSQHPCLVHSNAGNAMVTDHEDQTTLRTLASDYLPDGRQGGPQLERLHTSENALHNFCADIGTPKCNSMTGEGIACKARIPLSVQVRRIPCQRSRRHLVPSSWVDQLEL